MSKSYEVGYGRPPKHTKFKAGQSGNPKGRRKGARNLKTELEDALREQIHIREGGRTRSVSKQAALIKAMLAQAITGNTRAANIILTTILRLVSQEDEVVTPENLSEADRMILDAFRNQVLGGEERKGRGRNKKGSDR